MNDAPDLSRSFVARVLPWIAGAFFLVLYGVTACRWVNHLSLEVLNQATGWGWELPYHKPFLYLTGMFLRVLPGSVVPMAANLISAVCGALVIVNLARSVALLPHDRTREQRMRGHAEEPLLHIRFAWLPPVLAAGLLGFQLTFWEHATVFSGEMLDALVFSYLVRCLLEYRVSLRDSWLWRLAFLYGLAAANNWALIGFFPVTLITLLWIRGFSFFNADFLMRMALFGLCGLGLYLVMPAVAVAADRVDVTYGMALKSILSTQKAALLSAPRGRCFLFGLILVFPWLLIAVRWPGTKGSSVEKMITTGAMQLLALAWLAAIIVLSFDLTQFTPRGKLGEIRLLSFGFLGALAAGYLSGFFLLVWGTKPSRDMGRFRGGGLGALGPIAAGLIALASAGATVAIGVKNWNLVRDTGAYANLARLMGAGLPGQSAILLSDSWTHLQLMEMFQRTRSSGPRHVLVHTGSARRPDYRRYLLTQHQAEWPGLKEWVEAQENVAGLFLGQVLRAAAEGRAYYLHPSFGLFFENIQLRPAGLIQRMKTYGPDEAIPTPLNDEELKLNLERWKEVGSTLAVTGGLTNHTQSRLAGRLATRTANFVGVELQRSGKLPEAKQLFDMALALDPDNTAAAVNREVNAALTAGKPVAESTSRILADYEPTSVMNLFGPVDDPVFLQTWGRTCRNSVEELYRQAVAAYSRAYQLAPDSVGVAYNLAEAWLVAEYPDRAVEVVTQYTARPAAQKMTPEEFASLTQLEATARVRRGDFAGAEKGLQTALTLQPDNVALHDALSYLYIRTKRLDEANRAIDTWLKAKPGHIGARLRRAVVQMQQKRHADAVQTLNGVLNAEPENEVAILNRGISLLEIGKLDDAEKDYVKLEKLYPDRPEFQFGLGEIAAKRKDTTKALGHFEKYLKLAPASTPEYTNVVERIRQLKGGG